MAVVEAGLGGRLDATNVLARSTVQVLTNVSLEHAELLGATRELIARREAGGGAGGRPRGDRRAGLGGGGAAGGLDARWSRWAAPTRTRTGRWRGRRWRRRLGRPVDPSPIERLEVPGRLEVRGRHPLEIWDGAHNPAGMQRLVGELPALLGDRQAVAVFSALGGEGRGRR